MSDKSAILVSGADRNYFDLLHDLLQSLQRSGGLARYPLAFSTWA